MNGPTKTFKIRDCGGTYSFELSITRHGRYNIDGVSQPRWVTKSIDAFIFGKGRNASLAVSYVLDVITGGDMNMCDCDKVVDWVRKNFTYK